MSGARLRVPMRPCECAHDLTPRARRRPYGEASRGEPNLHTELARTADPRGRGGGEGIQPLCIEGCGVTRRFRVLCLLRYSYLAVLCVTQPKLYTTPLSCADIL